MYNVYANHIYTIVYALTKPFINIIYCQLIVIANRVVHIMCLKTENKLFQKNVLRIIHIRENTEFQIKRLLYVL